MAMRRVRELVNRLPDSKIDKLIDLCLKFEVDKILKEVVDLDFQGKSLVHLVQHPSVLIVALYSVFSSLI